MVRQHQVEGHGVTEVLSVLLARNRERTDVGEAARDEIRGSHREHVVAVEIEELDGSSDAIAKARAGQIPALDDSVKRRDHGTNPIATLEIARGASLDKECGSMRGDLKDLATTP